MPEPLAYLTGFANEWASEALPGALPQGQNSPQSCPHGLYAEQLSGTSFTVPRHLNRRSWCYRIRPAAAHLPFERLAHSGFELDDFPATPPNQFRWDPMPLPTNEAAVDFIDGLAAMAANGDPHSQQGTALYVYRANRSMQRFFYSADGEWLIVLQHGRLRFATEFGLIDAEPQEIVVIPRGVRFRVELLDTQARGYVCENYGAPFRLPDLGPIGSNGLANPRDFRSPVAWFEDIDGSFDLIAKFMGHLWCARLDHSPLDVVAWHGNLTPYVYDLRAFNAIGSISYDHPDPSIFLVLHSPSTAPGTGAIDFVVFPPRWLAAEHTFRPPWFHRNVASEFMGLVHGKYDGKADGFQPGGASLHNCMSGHGPDAATVEAAAQADTRFPHKVADTLAFMFETQHVLRPTRTALDSARLQAHYHRCWLDVPRRFGRART